MRSLLIWIIYFKNTPPPHTCRLNGGSPYAGLTLIQHWFNIVFAGSAVSKTYTLSMEGD